MEKSSDTFIESLKSKNVEFIANTSLTNVGEFKRISLGTIRIREKSEVRVVIEAANKWKVKLHPYSKGHNWGYGSHLPHQNEMFLLDLSQLNQIVSIDEDHGVVALEPGVTQKMLADELIRRNSKYHLDVTGSSEDTSVIGNSLERGIAYCGLRVDKVCGLEVILGNGTQLRTGFGDTPNPVLKGLYPYGLGPSLDGLFFQSNFGVVVEAHIQLLRKPENLITISASVNNENLSEFVNRVSELLKAGSIRGIPHLANRERTHSTLIPLVMRAGNLSLKDSSAVLNRVLPTDWSMTASVSGSAAIAREKVKKIKKELSPFGRLYFNHREKSPLRQFIEVQLVSLFANQDQKIVLEAAKGLQGFHIGRPSNDGVLFLMGSGNTPVDQSATGFLLNTPLAPLKGENAIFFKDIVLEHEKKFNIKTAMTLNSISEKILEAVISLHFDRINSEEVERAHECNKSLGRIFSEKGFYPYRVNIDSVEKLTETQTGLQSATSTIKRALDPNSIF